MANVKKREGRMKRTIISLPILLFSLTPSKGDEKFAFEISSGYSFGLSSEYRTVERYWRLYPPEKYYERHKLSFPLQLAMKYYISERFALQAEIEYQRNIRHRWGGRTEYVEKEKRDKSFLIYHIDLIYLFKERKRITPYAGGGIGFSLTPIFIPFPALRVAGEFQYKISYISRVVFGSSFLFYGRGSYFSLRSGLEIRVD